MRDRPWIVVSYILSEEHVGVAGNCVSRKMPTVISFTCEQIASRHSALPYEKDKLT